MKNEIKCPRCGEVFQVDGNSYATILSQVKDKEFTKEIKKQEANFQKALKHEVERAINDTEKSFLANIALKEAEIAKLKADIKSEQISKTSAINKITSQKDMEVIELKNKLASFNKDKDLEIANIVTEYSNKLSAQENFIVKLTNDNELAEKEYKLREQTLKDQYEDKLRFKDEEIAEDIDLFVKNMVKSGFFSEEDMLVGLRNYVEYNYEDYTSKLKSKQLPSLLSLYNEIYSNKSEPVNFRKLDAAFNQLAQNGFVAQHAIGNTDDEGFEECKDEAIERMDKGEDMVGCCFYTLQALFDMFENESNRLLLSYGNFHDSPDAVEVGNCICTQLKEAGFEVIWNKDVNTKIAVCIEWDNKYLDSE